jgi:hypothetical protein
LSGVRGEGGRKEVQRYVLFVHTLRVRTEVVVKSVAGETLVSKGQDVAQA